MGLKLNVAVASVVILFIIIGGDNMNFTNFFTKKEKGEVISMETFFEKNALHKSNDLTKERWDVGGMYDDYILENGDYTFTLTFKDVSAHTQFSAPEPDGGYETPSFTLQVHKKSDKSLVLKEKILELKCGSLYHDAFLHNNTLLLVYYDICAPSGVEKLNLLRLDISDLSKPLAPKIEVVNERDGLEKSAPYFMETPDKLYLAFSTGQHWGLFAVSGTARLGFATVTSQNTLEDFRTVVDRYNIHNRNGFVYEGYLYYSVRRPAEKGEISDAFLCRRLKMKRE